MSPFSCLIQDKGGINTTLQFQCRNGIESIPSRYKCDVYTDCDDKSDEEGCIYFVCNNGKKIAMDKKCDNNIDCEDTSDEKECASKDLVRNEGSCAEYSESCKNKATCSDLDDGKFACVCHPGFSGPTCETEWGEECKEPCEGEDCQRLATKMMGLLDMRVDPCEDFFKFVCNANTRGQYLPPANEPLKDLERLVRTPPKGFEFVNIFYESCMKISTNHSSLEVLKNCTADGVCTDEELRPYGQIYIEFLEYLEVFSRTMAFPVITPNWEEVTRNMSGGQGWTWWDVAADVLRNFSFMAVFQYVELYLVSIGQSCNKGQQKFFYNSVYMII